MALSKVSWRELELFDRDNDDIVDEAERRQYLEEFRRTGTIHGAFFHRIGADHEDPEDASTWGPTSPEAVDWSGFDE